MTLRKRYLERRHLIRWRHSLYPEAEPHSLGSILPPPLVTASQQLAGVTPVSCETDWAVYCATLSDVVAQVITHGLVILSDSPPPQSWIWHY